MQDPELCYAISDRLQVRLAGRHDILVQTEVRWVRDRKRPRELLGYGCAFSGTADRAVKKLLELAQSGPTDRKSVIVSLKQPSAD